MTTAELIERLRNPNLVLRQSRRNEIADALEAAKRENARLKAHIVASCRWCRGSGISGGSGGTGNAQVTLWKCYHGLPEVFGPALATDQKGGE